MLSWWNSHQLDCILNMNTHNITDKCFLSSRTFCPPVSCYSSWHISFSSSSPYFFCCIEGVLSQRVYSPKGLCLRIYCLRVRCLRLCCIRVCCRNTTKNKKIFNVAKMLQQNCINPHAATLWTRYRILGCVSRMWVKKLASGCLTWMHKWIFVCMVESSAGKRWVWKDGVRDVQ